MSEASDRVSKLSNHLSLNPTMAQQAKVEIKGSSENKLVGRCACGACGYEGSGDPAVTFYCHCSLCRRSGGAPFVGAAAFDPKNVKFFNEENIRDYTPPNSRVPRRYCRTCWTYLCEDARPVLGVYALPIGLSQEPIAKKYAPAQHIFYDSRIVDVSDNLPKFKKMPDGERA